MEKQPDEITRQLLQKRTLWLVAIVLGFICLLVAIWFWYSIKLKALDQKINQQANNTAAAKHHYYPDKKYYG